MTTDGSDWRRLQLERTLEQWRASNFDPHVVLGIPVGATPEQIIDAHRRWVAAYHPDLHDNDPLATELTQRVNAARDQLVGKSERETLQHREQQRRQEEARRRSARVAQEQRDVLERQRRERVRQRRSQFSQSNRQNYRPPNSSRRANPKRRKQNLVWALLFAATAVAVAVFFVLPTFLPDDASIIQPADEDSPTAEPTQTSQLVPVATPTALPILAPTVSPIPTATPHPINTVTPIPTATFTPTTTKTPTQTPEPTTQSGLTKTELVQAREYALSLINQARTDAGLDPVFLGDNVAAQSHSESAISNCFSSHWGIDGLKPYMRYSLTGGYQSNAENLSGLDYCITANDGYAENLSVEHEIRDATDGLMNSPGHRRNILNKWHKKVNIGLTLDEYNFSFVQHFEGDYVEYKILPSIENGLLSFNGFVKNGVTLEHEDNLGVQVFYDPQPLALTRGQLSRTYCLKGGTKIAALRPPVKPNQYYTSDSLTTEYSTPECPDPYDVPADAPAPRSADEAHEFWEEAYSASQVRVDRTVTSDRITASEWLVQDQEFYVSADITNIVDQYGNGVYTIVVWGEINGEDAPISEYSIFVPPLRTFQATVPAHATATPKPQPVQTPIGTTIPTPANTPTVKPVAKLTNPSGSNESELNEARQYALARINQTRTAAGLNPVTLDDNTAAQSHAADMRINCFHSHWGSDGLKSYMRYTLAGGHQYSSVYLSGSDYCPPDPERYRRRTVEEELSNLMDRLLADPDYLDVILDPNHMQVSFGVADEQPNFWFVQRFVGDFIEYVELPTINNQILSLSGQAKNGASLTGDSFGISIDYDRTPHALTRGQLHHTSCGTNGARIGALREPLEPNRYYTSDTFKPSGIRCQDPYYVPSDAPVATSYDDDVPRIRNPYENEAVWITATHWEVTDETFSITADISDLLAQHGDGVYTILVWAQINGEDVPISQYSIFIPPYEPAE